MESTLYKITDVNNHSGIFYGPYTFVYGFGVLISIVIYNFLEKVLPIKKKLIKVFIYFLLFTITLSLVEYLGGILLRFVFNVDLWNYSSHKDAIGKYICITNSLVWGILGVINIYVLYPKIKKMLIKLPHIYTFIIYGLMGIDIIITMIVRIIMQK